MATKATYDNSVAVVGGSTTITVAAGATMLLVWVVNTNDRTFNASVTAGGQAMTYIADKPNSNPGFAGNISCFYLINPPTGSVSVVVTGSVNYVAAVSYLGTQTVAPTNFTTYFDYGNFTHDVTLTVDNAHQDSAVAWFWIAYTAGGGSPVLSNHTGSTTNRVSSASSTTMYELDTEEGIAAGGSSTDHYQVLNLSSLGAFGVELLSEDVNVSDTTVISENVSATLNPKKINVSDTTVVTDAPGIVRPWQVNKNDTTNMSESVTIITAFPTFSDLLVSLITSGYKWLTSTLLTAQQSQTVRPYFSAQIIDDTIKPTGVSFNPLTPTAHGMAAPMPDDNIVAAGFGADNKIHFYKDRNLSDGTWGTDITLNSGTSFIPTFANTQVAIAVSDYINGNYHIDVAYFDNFNGSLGTQLVVQLHRSDDGGRTWTQTTITPGNMPQANYNVASPPNLYLCLMKPRLVGGAVQSTFVYQHPNGGSVGSGYTTYDIQYYKYSTIVGNSGLTAWGSNVDSGDWTIHSFDSYYYNGIDYLIFSGFRNVIDTPNFASTNQNANYALWLTAIVQRSANVGTNLDLWVPPVPILAADSATIANQNQFTYPRAIAQNGSVDVVIRAITVDSISQSGQGSTSGTVTTHENYQLLRSQDGTNFTYPQIIVDINGNEILEPTANSRLQSFVKQDNYYYLCGGDQVYQFIHNNTVADVSADVIGYTISEAAGQPSAINLSIANQNNQWVGQAPTNPGAAAIAGNSKIALWQGYYNSAGNPEAVPRNVYFIDDIQQQVSGKQNDLLITGRDWFKKLMTLITRYSLQWVGPFLYSDVFDGTTLNNWNQQAGVWNEDSNQLVATDNFSGQTVVTFAQSAQVPYGSTMAVSASKPTGGNLYIYAFYIDDSHFLRLNITDIGNPNFTWTVELGSDGNVVTALDTGNLTWSGSGNLNFFVRQYNYYTWNFMFTDHAATFVGNPINAWVDLRLIKNSTSGEFNLRDTYFLTNANFQKPFAVGLGGNVVSNAFSFFQYVQYGAIANIMSVTQALAAKAGVLNTVSQHMFDETLINPQYSGQFSVSNHRLNLPFSGQAMNTNSNFQMSNGEILFNAKVIPTNTGTGNEFGFSFIFRANSSTPTACYRFRIEQYIDGTGFSQCRFERLYSGQTYIFPNSSNDDQTVIPVPQFGSLNIDLTQYHQYKITMVDGWLFAYVDGIMVAAWNDMNTTASYLTSGSWGFLSNNGNSKVVIKNIYSPIFWKPVQTFSLNPGDDIQNAILSLVQSIRGWVFSDLLGRMKMLLLSSTDASNYTYNTQLWAQNVDDSDKEYISQVTVYGTGVMATARNTDLMAGVAVREAVIVDYTITTQSDAQVRANNELINSNQYLNQFEPTQVINVGAEIFDAITVTNTGNNTSGVNSPTRVYAQNFTDGGGGNSGDYSIRIQTGNL